MLCPRPATRQRSRLTRSLREFFWAQGFDEVDTFIATCAPAPEAGITPIGVHIGGTGGGQRFLQTSPELGMKRLLAGGWQNIFQLAAVFRDGDFGPWHRPEFRLLEWYRRGADWTAMMHDCEALMRHLTGGAAQLTWRGRTIRLDAPFPRLSMDALFRQHVGFSILEATDAGRLAALLRAHHIYHAASDTYADLFHRAFVQRVQPALEALDQPVFVTHFPAPLAALARLCPADPRAAERFEWLVAGCELANGFGELTCPDEQRRRFAAQAAQDRPAAGPQAPINEAFLAALADLGDCAGCAVGWDRLAMVLSDAPDLGGVEFVPWASA